MNPPTESQRLAKTDASQIQLRLATPQDSEHIFRWRNQPESRCWFNSTAEVTWDEHSQWYARKLADTACTMLIGEVESIPFGIIRFENEADALVVSANIDTTMRGQGLGWQLMKLGTHRALDKTDRSAVIAHTKKLNKASQSALYKAGYTLHEELDDELVFIYQLPPHASHPVSGA